MLAYLKTCSLVVLGIVYAFLSFYILDNLVPHLVSQPDDSLVAIGFGVAIVWLIFSLALYGALFIRTPRRSAHS